MKFFLTIIIIFLANVIFAVDLPLNTSNMQIGNKLIENDEALSKMKEIYRDIENEKKHSPLWYNQKIINDLINVIKKYPDSGAALFAKFSLLNIYTNEIQGIPINKKYLKISKKIIYEILAQHPKSWEAVMAKMSFALFAFLDKDLKGAIDVLHTLLPAIQKLEEEKENYPSYMVYRGIQRQDVQVIIAIMDFAEIAGDKQTYDEMLNLLKAKYKDDMDAKIHLSTVARMKAMREKADTANKKEAPSK